MTVQQLTFKRLRLLPVRTNIRQVHIKTQTSSDKLALSYSPSPTKETLSLTIFDFDWFVYVLLHRPWLWWWFTPAHWHTWNTKRTQINYNRFSSSNFFCFSTIFILNTTGQSSICWTINLYEYSIKSLNSDLNKDIYLSQVLTNKNLSTWHIWHGV